MPDQMDAMNKTLLEESRDRIREMLKKPLEDAALSSQLHEETSRHRAEGIFQRDYARIMYSSSFRRLQGKMQLLGIKQDQFFRNRLTHSLEVMQIARSIAGSLDYEPTELFVVEAGALAHDMGNPPFGHAGERYLHQYFGGIGGFEGNAQTLRILTNVEKKRADFRGLNLTYRTLLSIVKYFNRYDNGKHNKFIYDDDYEFLKTFLDEQQLKVRTLDVQIVDLADEIAYAAHDLEDGLRIKAFNMDEILHDYQGKYGNSDAFQKLTEVVEESRKKAGYGDKRIDSNEYSKLFRQEISSALINLFLNDITLAAVSDKQRIKTGTKQELELGFYQYKEMVTGLKEIIFMCINHNDKVYFYEESGKKVLQYLADIYIENPMYLPPEYRAKEVMEKYGDYGNQERYQKRLVCDYISGMMDSYAISCYEKISGKTFMCGLY